MSLCCFAFGEAAGRSDSHSAALDSITTENLEKHVRFLADDRLEGREAGSRGGREAGDYLAEQMARYELEPAGENGYFQHVPPRYRNVIGRLSGGDPDVGHETILVCAHYDHVGRGTSRNSRGQVGLIHNGADDNASGTAALVELAEAFSLLGRPPRRTILFVAWDAEEKGMLGSTHWARRPTVPLDDVAIVLNVDMIGRLRNNTVYVFGTRSGFGLRRLVAEQNHGLDLVFDWITKPNADHWPLFDRGVPYVMLHTGTHADYHTPNDTIDRIDHEGMRSVARLMFAVVHEAANRDRLPEFRPAARREDNQMSRGITSPVGSSPPPRLGVQWREPDGHDRGVQLTSVHAGTPAEAAQLRPGDRIVRLGEQEIETSDQLRRAVFHAVGPTPLVVQRPGEEEPRNVIAPLPQDRLRLGIAWRIDSAEPGTVVLTRVDAGSPAERAGLRPGDRVYQVGGEDFADEDQFAERVGRPSEDALELLIERGGRLETVVLEFNPVPRKRAA
ncbi:MAG: M28 family peptidase [Pirellulaceae bacterium]|nr:M28 family peptidase [Pirellulaceae bacterium]